MKRLWTKLKYRNLTVLFIVWFLIYKFLRRADLVQVIQGSLPLREAGLLSGMVWGEKGGISGDFYSLLKSSGLIHVVVVSGANLMIVGKSFVENLAKVIGRKMAIIGGGGVVLLYVNLVGWQIPVIRAVLFLGIFYWSQLLGRQFQSWKAVLVVGVVMTLADFRVLSDISFWLSMAAFTAVVLNKGEGLLKNTIWVSVFVLPILSMGFGKVSLITPIANFMVLFLVEILTILGFLGSLLGLIWLDLGRMVLIICYPLLRYLIEVVEFWGGGMGVVNFQFNWLMLIGWYLLIFRFWYEKKKI